jgi:muramoyltetrapeptide carboxypeptidase
VILIDPPSWPAHGRLWSHLVSDTSYDELHAFARRHGIPARGFDRDHYDVPAERYADLVAAGARPVGSRDVVSALTAAGLRRRRGDGPGRRAPGHELLRPPRLAPGAVVAVVAPAGPLRRERLTAGIEVLESWGLAVRVGPHVLDRHPTLDHLAASDADRAGDLLDAWCAPDVAVVWAARGGSGCHRLVDMLDWAAMTQVPPRLLVGFSDVTALHEAVAQRLGLVTVHGPVVTSLGDSDEPARAHVRRILFERDAALELATGLHRLRGGVAEGVLVGGNLRVVTASLGTRVSRPARGGIVVLEDVGEQAYRVDGMLTQLLRAGWFDGVRGVVTGAFTETDGTDVDAVVADRLGGLGVPLVTGAPVGHVPDNRPVPLGVPARLDADAGTLVLTRPALT